MTLLSLIGGTKKHDHIFIKEAVYNHLVNRKEQIKMCLLAKSMILLKYCNIHLKTQDSHNVWTTNAVFNQMSAAVNKKNRR